MSSLFARRCLQQCRSLFKHCRCSSRSFASSSTNSHHQHNKTDHNESENDAKTKDYVEEEEHAGDDDNDSVWIEAPTLECQLSQFDAIESFGEWVNKQWFASSAMKQNVEDYIHVIHKCYVPYWHFDATTLSTFKGTVAKERSDRTSERTSSCKYLSIEPELQICGNHGKLIEIEKRFLRIPYGQTQFQRMYHHIEDILPTTMSKNDATAQVRDWLKRAENARIMKLVDDEKLHHPVIDSTIDIECRKAYMPCFLLYFSARHKNAESQPNAITDEIPQNANLRAIVNGSSGNVLGPRLYSYQSVFKLTAFLSCLTVLPLTKFLMYYSFQNAIGATLLTGAALASVTQTPLYSGRYTTMDGDTSNTQYAQFKRQQLEDAEVEEILQAAQKAWSSYQHRARMFTREYESVKQTDYHSFADYTGTQYTTTDSGERVADPDHRPRRRKQVRFIELYEILGIAPNASTREIQQSFTKLVKVYHPDVLQTLSESERQIKSEKFQKILLAFQVLRDPNRRQVYDETGSTKEIKKKTSAAEQKKDTDQHNHEDDTDG